MHKLLDEYLCKKYPKIFSERNADMRTTCMCWGFSHGDGWFHLIETLCSSIQHHIDQHNNWVEEYGREFAEKDAKEGKTVDPRNTTLIPQVVAVQVKEKFGGLRFTMMVGTSVLKASFNMLNPSRITSAKNAACSIGP